MLVLSRMRDESLMIGDSIEITAVEIRGDKVRLGITAPKDIPVHRREIFDAIKREGRSIASLEDMAAAHQQHEAIEAGRQAVRTRATECIGRLYALANVNAMHLRSGFRNATASLIEADQMIGASCDARSLSMLLIAIRVSRLNLDVQPSLPIAEAVKSLLDLIPHLELAIDASAPRGPSPLLPAVAEMVKGGAM